MDIAGINVGYYQRLELFCLDIIIKKTSLKEAKKDSAILIDSYKRILCLFMWVLKETFIFILVYIKPVYSLVCTDPYLPRPVFGNVSDDVVAYACGIVEDGTPDGEILSVIHVQAIIRAKPHSLFWILEDICHGTIRQAVGILFKSDCISLWKKKIWYCYEEGK